MIIALSVAPVTAFPSAMPERFVSLADIDPSIIIEMRYAGSHNFLGRVVNGYEANKCIVLKELALALRDAQKKLRKRNLGLKLYDCYRPQMAVTAFMAWANDLSGVKLKQAFYPNVSKPELVKKTYIAARSGHSRGDSIDVTVVNLPAKNQPVFEPESQYDCTGEAASRYQDNSLDMGTGYDCFDTLSHTLNPLIVGQQMENRLLLKGVLVEHGFRNYSKEWWHFTYTKSAAKKQFYNFKIK